MKKNRALIFATENSRISFPYKYNFAETFNERFITITKWLKQLHKGNNTTDELVASFDLVIKLQSIIFEIGDDPFEVKLRNNYELLEDEYHESLERKLVLNKRIEKMKSTSMSLTEAKERELHAALTQKNSDIYIQRHKQMYTSQNLRFALFTGKRIYKFT